MKKILIIVSLILLTGCTSASVQCHCMNSGEVVASVWPARSDKDWNGFTARCEEWCAEVNGK